MADIETLSVRYVDLFALARDLKGMGERSILASRAPLRRDVLAEAARRFAAASEADGRTAVTAQILYLTGWAPGGPPAGLKSKSRTRYQHCSGS